LAAEKTPATSRLQLVLGALTLFALWFVLCRHLSGEWSANEQYSYGWFVPFFALFLFWMRWDDRPKVRSPALALAKAGRRTVIAVAVAILALGMLLVVRLFEVANPDWRPLGWVHAAAVGVLTLLVIWWMGGWAWVRHFALPVAFIFVAVPWISPIEQPIVQGLMRFVAALASEVIGVFGIPARVEGNLIRVSTGVVGVNEACSGVRSLQTSLMIGLLFGELKRLSVSRRLALVLGAVVLAIVCNFGRALFLVWVAATQSVSAVAGWHDIAGYAIVAVVFLGSLGLAALLARGRKSEVGGQKAHPESASIGQSSILHALSSLPPSYFLISLLYLLAVEIGVEAWYRSHEKNLASQPGWTVRPPENAAGFREIKIDDEVRQTLRFDRGREVVWKTSDPAAPENAITNYLFFFRWNPGSSSVVRARAHRPDICLPSAGWKQIADRGEKTYVANGGIALPMRRVSFRQENGNAVVHTFFCLREDKIRPDETRPDLQLAAGIQPDWSLGARARAVRNGIRNMGQQVMEFVMMSNRNVDAEALEPKFEQMIREVVVAE
jgi:exosortase